MKRILFTLIAGMFCGIVLSQDHIIANYFAEQAKDPTFERMEITDKTFELLSKIEPKDKTEQNVISAIKKLNGVLAIHKEFEDGEGQDLFDYGIKAIEKDADYEELVSVNTEDERVLFLIREDGETVKELSLVVHTTEEFFVATLFGDIDIRNLLNLSEVIKSDRKEWFAFFNAIEAEALVFGDDKAATRDQPAANGIDISELDVRISPNPADEFVRIEATGAGDATFQLSFYSLLGEQLKTMNNVSLPYTLQVNDLPSGAYFLRLTNIDGKYRNFRIVKP